MPSAKGVSSVPAGEYERILGEARRDGIRHYGVSAIILRNEKVLMVRRREHDFLGGIYEFPGGAVETGEDLADALIREVREETGLIVSGIGRYVGFFDYDSEDGARRRVFNFQVSVQKPLKIKLREHDRFVWAGEAELARLQLTEPILHTLKQFWTHTKTGGPDLSSS